MAGSPAHPAPPKPGHPLTPPAPTWSPISQAQRRREAEQAVLASCTFAPDIMPAAGSPLSAKFAGRAKGHIDLQVSGGKAGYAPGAAGAGLTSAAVTREL